jgi:hypothetical protein
LIELKDLKFIFQDQRPTILEKAKSFLMRKPDWIYDFEPFCDFIDSFPELITADEKANIREDFKEVAKDNVSELILTSYAPSPDYIRSRAYELKTLSTQFGVNTTKMLEELESYAETLENNPPHDKNDYSTTIEDHDCNDQDIESVFSALKETV